MNIDHINNVNSIIINIKIVCKYPFNPVFFMLLAVKSFETFP